MKTLDEAIELILPQFEGMESYIIERSEDEFAAFCHSQLSGGIGMQIRNKLSLWNDKSDLYQHFVKEHKCEHPDDMSDLIIRKIYRIKNESIRNNK